MPDFRPGLGDDAGRYVRHIYGYVEYRYAPGDTCEIVNIEVSEEHRRKGVGRRLVEMLLELVGGQARRVYVVTRKSNRPAQAFYAGVGFRRVAGLAGFYPDEDSDAVMFARDVP